VREAADHPTAGRKRERAAAVLDRERPVAGVVSDRAGSRRQRERENSKRDDE
jgi:hypothetical protein